MNIISVIIRTHNPRLEYLNRVLKSLEHQTLPKNQWELLVVDNASAPSLASKVKLDWHSQGRLIREERVGIVHATFRGISECRGDLLIFVDDDNILNLDYLEKASEIDKKFPTLGAWSGQVLPEYEVVPPEDLHIFLPMLALRSISRDFWSNSPDWKQLPWGAGMCFRREVAQKHCEGIMNNPLRLLLGHAGNRRSCHLDTDLALSCLDIGLGTGLFRSLTLTHLIPKQRLSEDYFLQLAENSAAAFEILIKVRQLKAIKPPRGWLWLVGRLNYLAAAPNQRRYAKALSRGKKNGQKTVADLPMIRVEKTKLNKEGNTESANLISTHNTL